MLTEQQVYLWLWKRSPYAYRVVAATRMLGGLVAVGLLSPTDEDALRDSAAAARLLHRAMRAGAAARLEGRPAEPPHLAGTRQFDAWLQGWRRPGVVADSPLAAARRLRTAARQLRRRGHRG
jgi:ribosome modulation factor